MHFWTFSDNYIKLVGMTVLDFQVISLSSTYVYMSFFRTQADCDGFSTVSNKVKIQCKNLMKKWTHHTVMYPYSNW